MTQPENRVADAIADLQVLADNAKSPAERAEYLDRIKFLKPYLKERNG